MNKHSIVLADWLRKATLINRSALCKSAGIDRGNLDKYLQRGEIPEKFIASLSKLLYDYGFRVAEDILPGMNIETTLNPISEKTVELTENEKEDILSKIKEKEAMKCPGYMNITKFKLNKEKQIQDLKNKL